MSNDYAIGLLIEQHHAELRDEAAQVRLARLARLAQLAKPRRPRWWERLMLARSSTLPAPGGGSRRPAATVAAGDSPC
jgi:hypothetical protein